jgi:hypothetical protein
MKNVALFFAVCICALQVGVATQSIYLAGATLIALLILAPEPKK